VLCGQRCTRKCFLSRRSADAAIKALKYSSPGAPPPPPDLLGEEPLEDELDEELLLELDEEDELLELLDEEDELDELDEELLELEELELLLGVAEASLDSALVPTLFTAATL
jgi:hypothetical protein